MIKRVAILLQCALSFLLFSSLSSTFVPNIVNAMTPIFLQAGQIDPNTSLNYLPIAIQLLFALLFIGGMMAITHWLGPKRNTSDKLAGFESGIESVGNARQPMAIKYFLVAILFVLFDVEVIFFYPYAVNFKVLGWDGFMAVILFVAFFMAGFFYIIKKGALKWED